MPQQTVRKDLFAEHLRSQNPSFEYWDDDRVVSFVQQNYPQMLSGLEFQEPPREPTIFEQAAAPWERQFHKSEQYFHSARNAFTKAFRPDIDKVRAIKKELATQGYSEEQMRPFIGPNFGLKDISDEYLTNLEEEYRLKDLADRDNYLKLKDVADKKIKDNPRIQAAEAWYAENPVDGFAEWWTPDNIVYGMNQMLSSYGPIFAGAYVGSVGGLFPPGGAAVAGSIGYTMEAGNNFETAYQDLIKAEVPEEQAYEIANHSSHLYGVASMVLESVAPMAATKGLKIAKNKLTPEGAKAFHKDILKGVFKDKKSWTGETIKDKLKENTAKHISKAYHMNKAFAGDGRVIGAVGKVIGLPFKAGKKVFYPSKFKLKQGALEGLTEGTQYLTEQAIMDGYVLPENGKPGQWKLDDIVSMDWMSTQLSSQGFKDAVSMGAMTYLLPWGGGGSTQRDATKKDGNISKSTNPVESGELKVIDKISDLDETVSDESNVPEGVQIWRDFANPTQVDETSDLNPGEQMLQHILDNGANAINNLESFRLTGEERNSLYQVIGQALNESNLPESIGLELNIDSETELYNPDEVANVIRGLVKIGAQSQETTESAGMGAETGFEINFDDVSEQDKGELINNPESFGAIDFGKLERMESKVFDNEQAMNQDMIQNEHTFENKVDQEKGEPLELKERITKVYNEEGEDAVRDRINKSNAKGFKELVNQLGLDKYEEIGGSPLSKNKDGSISANKKNKKIVADFIISTQNIYRDAFQGEDLFPEDDGSSEVAASDVGDTVSQEEDASHVDSKEEFRNLFSGEDSNFSELQDKGEPAPDETGLATPDLQKLKVAELKDIAEEQNIDGYKSMNKTQLLEALKDYVPPKIEDIFDFGDEGERNPFNGAGNTDGAEFSQIDDSGKQPLISEQPELAQEIADKLNKQFGGKLGITGEQVASVFDEHGQEVAGKAFKKLAQWSESKARIDDIPHEYFHIYLNMFENDPLLSKGIKEFGGKEQLTEHVGNYYANRMQDKRLSNRLKQWIKQLWLRVKKYFKGLSKEEYGDLIAGNFFKGRIPQVSQLQMLQAIYYSQADNQINMFESQQDGDGAPTEIDILDNLKDSASDSFLNNVFINVMGKYIPTKFMAVDVTEAAKKLMSYNEFSDWFKFELANRFDAHVLEGKEEAYDKYSRQLYQASRSRTPLFAFLDNDNKNQYTAVNEGLGRIKYELIFGDSQGNKDSYRLDHVSKNHRVRRGQSNPLSFRQNFIELQRDMGNIDARFIELSTKMIFNYVLPNLQKNPDGKPFYSDKWVSFKATGSWIDRFDNTFASQFEDGAGNLLFFFSTKSGDKPAMYFSAAPKKWTGSAQQSQKNKEIDVTKIDRDFFISELEAQIAKGWIAKNHARNMVNDADKLFKIKSRKVKTNKVDKKKKPIYKTIKVPSNPYAYAQVLSRHIRWQQVKANDYLMREKTDSNSRGVDNMVRRLPLDFSEGVTIHELSDRRVMWAPYEELEIELPDENGRMQRVDLQSFMGYKWDGGFFTGGRYLTEMSKLLGRNPVALMKTVVREISADQNDYYLSKHMEFSVWNGMRIFKKGESAPIAEVRGQGKGTYFVELDNAGNVVQEFDSFETNEELKDKSGRYNESFKVHTLPGESTKALIIPSNSNETAPHPINWHELVLDEELMSTPEGVEYQAALDEYIQQVTNKYIEKLISFRTNKKALRDYLKQDLQEGQLETELDKIIRLFPNGEGLSIPQYNQQVVKMLNNKMLVNGAFKLRADKGSGTKLYIKPHNQRIEEGTFAASSENNVIVEKVIQAYLKSRGMTSRHQPGWMLDTPQGRHAMFKELNRWLSNNEFLWLIHRQPLQGATKVEPRRLDRIVEGFHGDTVFLTDKDVYMLHEADNDGDTTFLERPDNDRLINAIKNLSQTEAWKRRDKKVLLSFFKRADKENSLSSRADVFDFYRKNAKLLNPQGMVVNAKTIAHILGYKKLSFRLNTFKANQDVRLHSRAASDVVVIDYLELNENMTQEEYEFIKENGDDVVINKDGEWVKVPWEFKNKKGKVVNGLKVASQAGFQLRLRTTFENEMSNLLQMAVDNPKEGLLSEFDFSFDFIVRRMFYGTLNGKEVVTSFNKNTLRALKAVYKSFNRSKTRRGRSMADNAISMGAIQNESEHIRSIYYDEEGALKNNEDVAASLHFIINGQPSMRKQVFVDGAKTWLELSDIQVDGSKVSAIEKILSSVDRVIKNNATKENGIGSGRNVMTNTEAAYKNAHVLSMEDLALAIKDKKTKYLKDKTKAVAIGEAIAFAEEIGKELEELYEEATKKKEIWSEETELASVGYEYSPVFQEFIAKWTPRWEKLSKLQKEWATLRFLEGTHKVNTKKKNTKVAFRMQFLPIQFMDESILTSYGISFMKHEKENHKKLTSSGRARYNFQMNDFAKLYKEKVCG